MLRIGTRIHRMTHQHTIQITQIHRVIQRPCHGKPSKTITTTTTITSIASATVQTVRCPRISDSAAVVAEINDATMIAAVKLAPPAPVQITETALARR